MFSESVSLPFAVLIVRGAIRLRLPAAIVVVPVLFMFPDDQVRSPTIVCVPAKEAPVKFRFWALIVPLSVAVPAARFFGPVPVNDVPVANRARGSGTLSCLAGHATTADTLTFARRSRLRILTDITGGLTQFAGRFRGAVSGDGIVEVNVLPYADQPLLEACQAQALRAARYDLVARTITPVVG